ncbi:12254_t:CDS:2 [Ambispora gerdemannii]|uniref:12254_t:CDS:1 n=1 Tax=Ambispora gerdemannii TaxID=144530 RepID=A0A9N9E6C0_9GLOM|nr:12254_t:CDS:2 [Ambispora gerdemannii]
MEVSVYVASSVYALSRPIPLCSTFPLLRSLQVEFHYVVNSILAAITLCTFVAYDLLRNVDTDGSEVPMTLFESTLLDDVADTY